MENDREMSKDRKRSLIERLNSGPVICAEGFLFEIERRGYMSSGEFVPMVSLDLCHSKYLSLKYFQPSSWVLFQWD